MRSDATFVTSQFLSYNLRKKFDNVSLGCEYLPLERFQEEIELTSFRPAHRRKNFYFIGNMALDSNRDCVERLLKIWGLMSSEFPQEELHLISSNFPQEIFKNRENLLKQRVVLKTSIDDLEEIEKYRMLLAPLRYHVGVPGKIIDSWFYHTPVVTTPYGSESLFFECPEMALSRTHGKFLGEKTQLNDQEQHQQNQIQEYYKANTIGQDGFDLNFGGLWRNYTDEEFINSTISLYRDTSLWNKCRETGEKTISRHHSDEQHFKRIIAAGTNADYLRAIAT